MNDKLTLMHGTKHTKTVRTVKKYRHPKASESLPTVYPPFVPRLRTAQTLNAHYHHSRRHILHGLDLEVTPALRTPRVLIKLPHRSWIRC
jgi:hypothetical protein